MDPDRRAPRRADQWPLALGSYLEANRLINALAEAHPAFEPEMVAYRREALEKTIAETEGGSPLTNTRR